MSSLVAKYFSFSSWMLEDAYAFSTKENQSLGMKSGSHLIHTFVAKLLYYSNAKIFNSCIKQLVLHFTIIFTLYPVIASKAYRTKFFFNFFARYQLSNKNFLINFLATIWFKSYIAMHL